jgi:hypothetical protein
MTKETYGGWSLEEAHARTSEPRLWDRYQAEKRQQAPISVDLRRTLVRDVVAKVGTQLVAATPKPSGEDRWIFLDRAALEKEIASEKADEIRLFPPLGAPNAFELLKDLGLGGAFQQYVVSDPEITVLIERSGLRDRFEEGRCPLSLSSHHWPLEATVKSFEYRLTEGGGILTFGGPERRPTPVVSKLSVALVDRLAALRGLLISGKIQASGLTANFAESLVPPRVWARKNLSIDVANGDLCEEDDRGNLSPIWTSVELRAREAVLREEPVLKAVAPVRKRSPKGREVERIITEKEIDVGRLGRKAAASEVAKYMKPALQAANEVKALEALVDRIWKATNKTA